jgi:hypothetical protein
MFFLHLLFLVKFDPIGHRLTYSLRVKSRYEIRVDVLSSHHGDTTLVDDDNDDDDDDDDDVCFYV